MSLYDNVNSSSNFRFYNTLRYENKRCFVNIHFKTAEKLKTFIKKMRTLKSNLWFDPRRCCDGHGCEVEFINV